MIDKEANRRLVKGLNAKKRKAGWWARRSRRKLVEEIVDVLSEYKAKAAWAHRAFVTAEEKRPKNITVYVEFPASSPEGVAEKLGMRMDNAIEKKHIDIIDVRTLLPKVREFVFKDVEQIL